MHSFEGFFAISYLAFHSVYSSYSVPLSIMYSMLLKEFHLIFTFSSVYRRTPDQLLRAMRLGDLIPIIPATATKVRDNFDYLTECSLVLKGRGGEERRGKESIDEEERRGKERRGEKDEESRE